MNKLKPWILNPYNVIFYFLAGLTCALEVMGLYSILGLEITIFIAIVISFTKALFLLNKDWKVYIVLIFSMFFSVQKPLLVLTNKEDNTNTIKYLQENLDRTKLEYNTLIDQYNSSKKVYDNAQKDKAWGITREYDKSNRLTQLREESSDLKNKIAQLELELIQFKKHSENWYKSVLRLIVILVAEFILFMAASKFRIIRKPGRPMGYKNFNKSKKNLKSLNSSSTN